jgi:hypothetical protein
MERLFHKLYSNLKPNAKMTFERARDILKEPRVLSTACQHHYDLDAVVYCSEAQ